MCNPSDRGAAFAACCAPDCACAENPAADGAAPPTDRGDAVVDAGRELALGEQLESMPADAKLAALVLATDPALLTPDQQVSFTIACQRLINTFTACQDAGLIAFAGANPRDTIYFVDGNEHAITDARALELQLALAWSEGHTRTRIQNARTLTTQLPQCSTTVAAGAVQPLVTRAIAEGAASLTATIDEAIAIACQTKAISAEIQALRDTRTELLSTFDATLAAFAPNRSLKAVGKKVRDTIARLDPAGVLARRAKAIRTHTDVRITPLNDGMACLTAILPTEQAHACLRVIDTVARDTNTYDNTDPIGLRRTQVLFDLVARGTDAVGLGRSGCSMRLEGRSLRRPDRATSCAAGAVQPTGSSEELRSPGPTPNHLPAVRGRSGLPVHLDVVMNLDTFLGLTDDTAVMPGAGPVPAQAVRELLADAAWVKIRRILTDPKTGHALDLGVRRYQLTEAEQQRIALRDRTCRMIDCQAPAYRCECDHAQPYNHGGPTKTANLGLACKRHHQHKTHAGWTIIDSQDDGSCTWTSPLGRTYRHEAEPVLPHAALRATEPANTEPTDIEPAPPTRDDPRPINPEDDPPPF